ncbi:hypothetical protein [Brevundimonas sp.]|uniref:hypothetical protein n=1 Tax=Brevundimonas sp. TaxID=1871086 RepID=UPI0028997F6A|nr:hypothetical protein [Brevundimonas sp.]
MFLTDERLTHASHLADNRWNWTENEESNRFFRNEAANMHAIVVLDAVSNLMVAAVNLGNEKGGGVRDHLVFGVGRRAGDIRVSLRDIIRTSPPDRTRSLDTDETDIISRGLNTIYINLRGGLDNLAYALVEKHGGMDALGLKPPHVDLFSARFQKSEAGAALADELAQFVPWVEELAERRNPAAHRIPLSVIPARLNDEEFAERQRLLNEMVAPLGEGPIDFDKKRAEHKMIKGKIASLGTYLPQFAHDPNQGVTDIYPTVAEDVGTMVRIGRMVLRYIA